jgi:tetratricopeptide (TPR) repeat protein
MMKNILGLLVVVSMFISCGTDTTINNESGNPIQDTTETEQTKEFKAINALLKDDIDNTALYLRRARLYMKYDDLPSAVNDVDRAIRLDSLSPEYYLLKAELLKKQDLLKESKEALDQCMLVDNNNLEARIELGWLALIARDYKQGIEYADAVLKRDIYNAEAYYLKGLIFEEQLDTTLAISTFKTVIEQENDFYDAYIHLGLLHFNKDLNLAKEYLKNALRIEPKSLEALYAYALCCQEKGDYNESIENYHKILAIEQYREPYFNLGYIHQEYLKVYDVAIDNYTKAIEIEPKYIEAYYNRGLCYEQLDEYKKAEDDFRYSLQLNPQYTTAALALERVINK